MARMGLNDSKAGMTGLDKQKINRIILEATKGSRFYNNEMRKEKQATERVTRLKAKLTKITQAQRLAALDELKRMENQLETTRDLSRFIVHVDMDAFYAAIEIRDNPSLADKPMAVGGTGMMLTSNYIARRYGVRAAMPGFIGKRLCPDLVFVKPNSAKYAQASKEVRAILAEYDPNFASVSLDEAYMDLTEYLEGRKCTFPSSHVEFTVPQQDLTEDMLKILNEVAPPTVDGVDSYNNCSSNSSIRKVSFGHTIEDVMREIRFKINRKTKLTASAGIGPNKMLAKICSDWKKPNGQFKVEFTRDKIIEFMRQLPTRKISGIGKVSERLLNEIEISNCKELYDKRDLIYLLFSNVSTKFFLAVAMGIGSNEVSSKNYQRKSISCERTFGEISRLADMLVKCQKLCDNLANHMKKENITGRCLTVKLKTVAFEVKQRSVSLKHHTNSTTEMFNIASEVIRSERLACQPERLRLRLMGIKMSTLKRHESDEKSIQDTLTRYFNKYDENCSQSQSTINEASKSFINIEQHKLDEKSKLDKVTCYFSKYDENSSQLQSTMKEASKNCDNMEKVTCPVCDQFYVYKSDETSWLALLNSHIDTCLQQPETMKPSQSHNDSVGSSKGKGVKRRKLQHNRMQPTTGNKTLHNFWQAKDNTHQ
ncbi:uncharacterized protein TRIADDRAFT_22932 [Trichoplax adhaerens]|uniref:DNA polymerase kappa n=1 Tax=Trichoplax adhaerens TaxID=10228 RepID=B3RS03_TRIAD|nr:hypothetical protein TRIADDRAFT_22932 [Trichoplax adhaerens]EDV26438.1 hypothetical protein TRIADDRAFT_22932 [Trichoplax adhaerens]|eukprot:XP_002110434.1 hypothetical protein TRIADDRAFT_22932 [Trichoplax adhaerens]